MASKLFPTCKEFTEKFSHQSREKDNVNERSDALRDERKKRFEMNRKLREKISVLADELVNGSEIKLSGESIRLLSLDSMLRWSCCALEISALRDSLGVYDIMLLMTDHFKLAMVKGKKFTAFWAAVGLLEISLLFVVCAQTNTRTEISNSDDEILPFAREFLNLLQLAEEQDKLLFEASRIEREFRREEDDVIQRYRGKCAFLADVKRKRFNGLLLEKGNNPDGLNEREKAVFDNDCRIEYLSDNLKSLYNTWIAIDNEAEHYRRTAENEYQSMWCKCEDRFRILAEHGAETIRDRMLSQFRGIVCINVYVNVVNPFDAGKALDYHADRIHEQMISGFAAEKVRHEASRQSIKKYAEAVLYKLSLFPVR